MAFYSTQAQPPGDTYYDSFIKTIAIQEVLWIQMPKGFETKLELISPVRAKVTAYKSSAYVRFVAQAKHSSDKPNIIEGEFLYIQMPLRTWERAMYSIPMEKKRNWNNLGKDNIYIELRKVNRTLLEFKEVERRKTSTEQQKVADEYYYD